MTLLERQNELSSLAATLDDAASGHGAVTVIEGPPGIGKTRLLEAAVQEARRRGMQILRARAGELEREYALGVARQLFEPVLRAAAAPERERLLDAAGIARSLFDAGAPEPEGEHSFGTLGGLVSLAAALAEEGSLLLAVDDAHAADPSSLRFLAYLARRIDDLGALLCVAMRPAAPPDAGSLLDALARAGEPTWLRPAPLSAEASAEIVQDRLGDASAELCLECHRASGGNPLLVTELARALRANGAEGAVNGVGVVREIGPLAVSRAVALRLAPLPEATRRFATAAAVLGDGATPGVAAELAGAGAAEGRSAFDSLRELEVLEPGTAIAFVHPLVREALLTDAGGGTSRRLHADAARLLAARGGRAEEIASHLLAAEPASDPERVSTLRASAARSLGAGDPEAAVAYLRRALEEPPADEERVALLMELARVEGLVDKPAVAGRIVEARELASDPLQRCSISAELAWRHLAEEPEAAVAVAEETIEDLGDLAPELRRRLEATALMGALLLPEPVPEALIRRARSRGPSGEPSARMLAGALGYLDARASRPREDVLGTLRAAFSGEWTGDAVVAGPHLMVGLIALIAADSADVMPICEDWTALARRKGSLSTFSAARMARAHARLAAGEVGEAAADAADAIEALTIYGLGGASLDLAASTLADALMAAGDLEGAREALQKADGGNPNAIGVHTVSASRARLRARAGDPASALQETLRLGRRFEALGGRNPALLPWRTEAAELLGVLGEDPDRALALAQEEVELARAWGAPRALGRALTAAGRAARGAEGAALLEQALAALDGAPGAIERAGALLSLGTLRNRRRSAAEARKPLREAMSIAASVGAGSLEARARDALVAAGGRPRRPAAARAPALTPGERRVALLAARGLSNREIGQELYLAPRTVESHLHRVYRKLGIGSRSQLAAALDP